MKKREQEDAFTQTQIIHNPIPTPLFCFTILFVCCGLRRAVDFMHAHAYVRGQRPRVRRRFVPGSREISLASSLHRASLTYDSYIPGLLERNINNK